MLKHIVKCNTVQEKKQQADTTLIKFSSREHHFYMLILPLGLVAVLQVLTPVLTQDKVRMCYFTNWAQRRQDIQYRFTPDNLDPFICTHVLYAFAHISADRTTVKTTDPFDEEFYSRIIGLKQQNPNLKVLLSVGGWNSDQTALFDELARNINGTELFVNNVIKFLRQHGFDGLDVDWEFPNITNRLHFTNFIAGLSNGFSRENLDSGHVKLVLTIAVWGNHKQTLNSYEPNNLARYVDYFLLMAYNLWGSGYVTKLGHHTDLYARHQDAEDTELGRYSANKTVRKWIELGISRDKLVLGLASYGQSAKLIRSVLHNVGDPHNGSAGTFGELAYYKVCENLANNGWSRLYNPTMEGAFAYSNRSLNWVCYDDPMTIRAKTEYALNQGLAGVFMWTVDYDDFTGQACNNGPWPLLRTVRSVLENQTVSPPMDVSQTTTVAQTTASTTSTTSATSTTTSTRLPNTGETKILLPRECKQFQCPAEISPSTLNYLYPDPYNCTMYYQCGAPGTTGSGMFHMVCFARLFFNPQTLRCDWPNNAMNCTPCVPAG